MSIVEVIEKTEVSVTCVVRILINGVHVGDTVYWSSDGERPSGSLPVVVEAIWKAGRSIEYMDAPHGVKVDLKGTRTDLLEAGGFMCVLC